MAQYRKSKSNWTKPSVNKMTSSRDAAAKYKTGEYRINSPWDPQDEDAVDEFERTLETMDVHVAHPWDESAEDCRNTSMAETKAKNYELHSFFEEDEATLRRQAKEKESAKGYQYKSMFEVPPLTAKQQKTIDEYAMNPPFRVAYNQEPENKKTAKKLAPGKNPATRKPWEYGSVPADPIAKPMHPQPPTGLWTVPPPDKTLEETMESSGDPVLDSLRLQLKKHGASGIAGLSRKFRIMDDDESGTLDMQEFVKGMKECKLADLGEKALKHLFRYFDKDDSGVISYDEFLVGVRGVLNERRKKMVHMAFNILDRDGSGIVEMDDIKGVFNAKSHPDVVLEIRKEEEILQEFMESFQVGKEKDAVITLEEFENYYANLSASIDLDDYFELMIRNAWHISGGEGWAANTTNRRVLVTHADGRQSVEEIQNDLGLAADDKKGMVQRLKAQGLKMASINTNGLGDMGNQYEDPDFVQHREELAKNAQSATGGAGGTGGSNLPGGGVPPASGGDENIPRQPRLSDYATSTANTGRTIGSSRVGGGPRSSAGMHSGKSRSAHPYPNPKPNSAKPVALSSYAGRS